MEPMNKKNRIPFSKVTTLITFLLAPSFDGCFCQPFLRIKIYCKSGLEILFRAYQIKKWLPEVYRKHQFKLPQNKVS